MAIIMAVKAATTGVTRTDVAQARAVGKISPPLATMAHLATTARLATMAITARATTTKETAADSTIMATIM